MVLFKVSKDPSTDFNTLGHYKVATWKSYDDIRFGVDFNGKTVAQSDYLTVEKRYMAFLLDLSQKLDCPFLAVDVETIDLDERSVSSLSLNDENREKFLEDWLRQKIYATLYLKTVKLTLENYILYIDGEIDHQVIEYLSYRHQLYCDEVLPSEQITCLQISKYNPIYRDEQGRYTRDEWTDFSDVGKEYVDGVLTMPDYEKVEQQYLATAYDCFIHFQEENLYLVDIEYHNSPVERDLLGTYEKIKRGESLFALAELPNLVRLILRGYIWGKIIGEELECHFGFDFYMYLISARESEAIMDRVRQHNLFARIIDDFED